METLGQFLTREREFRGITTEKLSQDTRISLSVIKQIESDNFMTGPQAIYIRGFLRTYAKRLGLNVDETLTRYNALTSSRVAESLSVDTSRTSKAPLLIIIVVIAGILLALAAYLHYR